MTLQEQLCEKMRVEQSAYCLWLTAQPPEEILHHAYEYSVREDIILATEEMNLTLAQVRALLKSPAPLADVYKDFSKLETDYMSIVAQCVEDRADDLLKKEQQQNPPKVYRQSVTYAREHGELQQYHASCHLNERCRDEIDAALAQRFDGMRLGAGAVEQVVAEYGLERTKYVLAAAIQTRDAVINSAAYAVNDAMRHTLYYTQRNQGKFILVETKAPAGYFGDWTDIDRPGTAGTPLGKRAYYIEITQDNDSSVLWLDNADYNVDILTTDKGGTKLVTSGGVETTVTISNVYKNPNRSYNTDNSGKAANEDSYTTTATDGVMKNDRTLGEISISKVDLDAAKYVENHGNATLDGAVYDLYAAEDITHPDGVTGVVDYSKIVDADGNPIWHTTIRDNSGQWVSDYLPVLKKDHLVASAKIENGWLCFSNLYLGKYYVVERSTGVIIPLRDGALAVSGTYPTVDSRTKAATGQTAALAKNGSGQYTDWVYKNQFSTVSKGKALDGSWTYDAYYLSFADGYLVDEHNYYITPAYSDEGWYVEKTTFADNRQAAGEQIDKTSYSANYHIHADNALAESQDQVAKGNVEISKIVSSSGQSNGLELEGAGFTFFLVSDLSKLKQFEQTRSGSYTLQSILDAYIDKTYDNEHPKWDFSAETQAIAKTYEVNADEIAAYNKTLTAAGENKNGKGNGWQPTGSSNEYQLAEIFSNDTGNIRVQGLPYGTYLVVETTVPHDLFQAEPFIVTVDPEQDNNPWGAMATPKGSVMTGSDSYQKFTVLDEEIEVYLRITKVDEETGKPVLLPDTAFQIYWLDEQGHYRYDSNGNPKLVTMTDTVNGHLTKDVDTFYTNSEGNLTLPEKLPLGKYRIVEVTGPNGFYNEWKDTAGYENGILADDADGIYYVDFEITTDRIYAATGDKNENGMNNGGEAADQMVREALQVTEVAIKLSALGIKNALALSLAYAKENPKVKGKTSLDRLLREGKELKIIALQSKDVGQFKELAKQYGVLFAVIKDKAQNEKVDVMFKAEDVAKLNRIYEQLGYAIPKVTTADRKKDPTRRQSGDSLLTRGKNPLNIDPRPSVRATIMALKNAARTAAQAQEKVQDITAKEER